MNHFSFLSRDEARGGLRRMGRCLEALIPADGRFAEAIHILVLCTLVVAQPLWSLVGKSGEFFLARDADAAEITLAALAVLLVPPAILLAVQWGISLVNDRLRRVAHLTQIWGLAVLMLLRVFGRILPQPDWVLIGAASAGASIVLAAVMLTRATRWTVTALAPLPVLLLILFLFTSEARAVVVHRDEARIGGPVGLSQKAPVVFIVLDEFSGTSIMKDGLELNASLVPNIAEFAEQATWYRNATTVHDVTDRAVPAILSGKRASSENLPVAGRYPVNLFSLLGKAGYLIRADEYLTRLCPKTYCPPTGKRQALFPRVRSELEDLALVYAHEALPPQMVRRLPPLNGTWGNFLARPQPGKPRIRALRGALNDGGLDQASRIGDFLRRTTPLTRPTLDYLHVSIPHVPFDRLPNGRRYNNIELLGLDEKSVWSADPFFSDQGQQRNFLQVGYADHQFGRILKHLREIGLFDRSLIVMVSDHGSANLPGAPRRAFAKQSLGEVASVPLFIKLPGQKEGFIFDKSAETVDVLPTIADVLRVQVPLPIEGRSLLDPQLPERPKTLVDERGTPISVPAHFPHRHLAVARNFSRFARTGDSLNLFAVGPYRDLVGSRVDRLRISAQDGLKASLDQPDLLTSGGPPDFSPSHIVGRLSGLPAGTLAGTPLHLAISVRGTIVATSRSYDAKGEDSLLSMFIPDEALPRELSELEIFAVTGLVDEPDLIRVDWS